MKNIRWVLIVLCVVGGIWFGFFLPGYLYIGLSCFGIAILLVVYHLLRNRPKGKKILSILLLVCLLLLLVVELPIVRASFGDPSAEVDYLIVLGAQVRGRTPSRSMVDRLSAAAEYLNTHPDTVVIVSGGQGDGEDITEAQAMRDWLVADGITASRIWLEPNATSTMENLEFSFALIENDGGNLTRVGIVSSEYHLYRASYMAEKQFGVPVAGIPAHTAYPLMMVNYFLREAIAVVLLWIGR